MDREVGERVRHEGLRVERRAPMAAARRPPGGSSVASTRHPKGRDVHPPDVRILEPPLAAGTPRSGRAPRGSTAASAVFPAHRCSTHAMSPRRSTASAGLRVAREGGRRQHDHSSALSPARTTAPVARTRPRRAPRARRPHRPTARCARPERRRRRGARADHRSAARRVPAAARGLVDQDAVAAAARQQPQLRVAIERGAPEIVPRAAASHSLQMRALRQNGM